MYALSIVCYKDGKHFQKDIHMKYFFVCFLASIGLAISTPSPAKAVEKVTVDNFIRAETDTTFARYVKNQAFGKLLHFRKPTPIDKQNVIRMNRDTIYSVGVFDLTEPVTIVKPDGKGRYQSMQVLNQDQYTLAVETGKGEFTFTRDTVGTRYVLFLFRTFINANDPADIKAGNELQDQIAVRQKSAGTFDVPDWDQKSLAGLRDAINVLAATKTNTIGMFGNIKQVDPINHLLGTAYGWGGLPEYAAFYVNVEPEKNDGKTPYSLTIAQKIPTEGFCSITVYNAKGFMEKNKWNAYSVNNVTAKKNPDGSATVHFGGDPSQSNFLPITPGWNYIVRMYQPDKEVINGTWKFPEAQPVQ
jgi:hypothetical protein